MKRMYLMKGMAALAMGLVTVSCNKVDFGGQSQVSKEDALANAELQLGASIDPNQDWNMVKEVEAYVSVNMATGKNYNYAIYSNDPLADHVGIYLAKGTVKDGESFSVKMNCGIAVSQLVIGLTDESNLTFYKRAYIEDGKINVNFVGAGSQNAPALKRSITVKTDVYDKFPSADEVSAYFPTTIPADADEVSQLEALYKGTKAQTPYGETVMYDIYAIYANKIVEGYNLKITQAGTTELGGNYQNSGWDQTAGKNIAHPYNVYVNVDGDVTIKRVGATHFNLYILKGNVTLESDYGEQAGLISVASGATLNDQRNSIAANQGVKIFNRGTINATNTEKYDIGNFCTVYNEGKFNVRGAMTYSPGDANDSYFMNLGDNAELTAASMTLNSTGNFFNSGKVRIAGETNVTQARLYWVNNGNYTTGSMTFSAKNTTFFNYCQLIVRGNAHMYDGEFNLMKDSYMEAGTAEMDNFIVNMNGDAGVHIKGAVDIKAQGDGTYQGFKANGTGNKLLIDGTVTVASHRKTLSISEGITYSIHKIEIIKGGSVVTEEALKANGDGDYPVLDLQGLECASGTFTVTPNATGCGATTDTTIIVIPNEPQIFSYAFEDTKVGDYDLNDVVLKAQEDDDNIKLTLAAAGATLDLVIRLYDYDESGENGYGSNYVELKDNDGNTEIHDILRVERKTMVNTAGNSVNANPYTFTISKSQYDASKLRLAIYSTAQGEVRLSGSGDTPHGVMIPFDWRWPTERTHITQAYNKTDAPEAETNQSFTNFMSNAGHAELWYKYPTKNTMKK